MLDPTHDLAIGMQVSSNSEVLNKYWMQGGKEHISSFMHTLNETAVAINYEDATNFIKSIYPFFDPDTSDPYVIFAKYKDNAKDIKEAEELARKILKPANRPILSNDAVMVILIRPIELGKEAYNYTFYIKYNVPVVHINHIIIEKWEPANE